MKNKLIYIFIIVIQFEISGLSFASCDAPVPDSLDVMATKADLIFVGRVKEVGGLWKWFGDYDKYALFEVEEVIKGEPAKELKVYFLSFGKKPWPDSRNISRCDLDMAGTSFAVTKDRERKLVFAIKIKEGFLTNGGRGGGGRITLFEEKGNKFISEVREILSKERKK